MNLIDLKSAALLTLGVYGSALGGTSTLPSLAQARSTEVACPTRDFGEFVTAFSESKDVQKGFTASPLTQIRLDHTATPDPVPVTTRSSADQIIFPAMPDAAERNRNKLTMRIDAVESDSAVVTLFKDDTDWTLSYFFSLDKCWQLQRIENNSL